MAWHYLPKGRTVYMLGWYDHHGKLQRESTNTTSETRAKKMAAAKGTDKERGLPAAAGIGKILFGTLSQGTAPATGAVALFEADYLKNNFRSLADQQRRIRLHLDPVFGGRRMADISAEEIASYMTARRSAGAAAGQVNREMDVLRRMFTLCIEQGRLLYRPHIPRLRERNARTGFFERGAFEAVLLHLPEHLRPPLLFGYLTGWRVDSEVLTREWRHVDFEANEIRLDPGETKNGEPRVFPLTVELRALLLAQKARADRMVAAGFLCPLVFFRPVNVVRRRGLKWADPPQRPKRLVDFRVEWRKACRLAGCPGRLVHDLRRTAVRNMTRSGLAERVAMQLAGHLTRTVFDRYNIVSPGDLTAAQERLSGQGFEKVITSMITSSEKSGPTMADTPQNLKDFARARRG